MTTYKTAVEHYVKDYLRTHRLGSLPRSFVEKAKVIVDTKLNNPCCTDSGAIINMITTRNSPFVNMVQILVNQIPKAGNTQSLQRTSDMLQKRLTCTECY